MAIVVEEEKSRSNIGSIIFWLLLIGGALYGAYYLFFAHPEAIELKLPQVLRNSSDLVKINIKPEDVLSSQSFKQFSAPQLPNSQASLGRSNPFQAF